MLIRVFVERAPQPDNKRKPRWVVDDRFNVVLRNLIDITLPQPEHQRMFRSETTFEDPIDGQIRHKGSTCFEDRTSAVMSARGLINERLAERNSRDYAAFLRNQLAALDKEPESVNVITELNGADRQLVEAIAQAVKAATMQASMSTSGGPLTVVITDCGTAGELLPA